MDETKTSLPEDVEKVLEEVEEENDQSLEEEEATEEAKEPATARQPRTLQEIANIVKESYEARRKLLNSVRNSIKTSTGRKQALGKLATVVTALNGAVTNTLYEILNTSQKLVQMQMEYRTIGFHNSVLVSTLVEKGVVTTDELQKVAEDLENRMQNEKMKALAQAKMEQDEGPNCRTCDACDHFQRCALMDEERVDNFYHNGGAPEKCPLRPIPEEPKQEENKEEEKSDAGPEV